jgi:hypothetical protein
MRIVKSERIKGATYDYSHMLTLAEDDCHILAVSSRTLYMLANQAQFEANFTARYILEYLDGGLVRVPDQYDPEADQIALMAHNYRVEVVPVTCDFVAALDGIRLAVNLVADKISKLQLINQCCPEGTGTEVEPEGASEVDTPIGPGQTYPTYEDYEPIKCNVANWIIDGTAELIDEFDLINIDNLVTGGGALVGAAIVILLTASPVGILASIAIGTVAALTAFVLATLNFNIETVNAEFDTVLDELKQALYCATSTNEARIAISDILSSTAMSSTDVDFVLLILNNFVLNELFAPGATSSIYEGEYTCADCAQDCDWMIAPAAMGLSRGFTDVSTVNGGTISSGFLDNATETTFQVQSVLGEISATPVQVMMMCTREFYKAWINAGMVIPLGEDCGCDEVGGAGTHKDIELIVPVGGAFSIWRRRCISGTIQDIGLAAFTDPVEYSLAAFAWHRNNTSGPFTASFRILVP